MADPYKKIADAMDGVKIPPPEPKDAKAGAQKAGQKFTKRSDDPEFKKKLAESMKRQEQYLKIKPKAPK